MSKTFVRSDMRDLSDSAKWMSVTFSSDGLISSISSSVEQLTGYSAQELMDRPISYILADETLFQMPQMMDLTRQWGAWDGKIIHRNRTGRCFNGRGSLSLLSRRSSGAGYSMVTLLNENCEYEEQDDVALQKVGTRIRSLAHEMNNPLAVIAGFAQLIMMDNECNGKIQADMEKLFSELQRVIQVVEKLYSYALSLHSTQPEQLRKTS